MKKSTLRTAIRKALITGNGKSLAKNELIKVIGTDSSMKTELSDVLASMVKTGELIQGKKGKYAIGKEPERRTRGVKKLSKVQSSKKQERANRAAGAKGVLVGTFRQHPAGFGWFYPDLSIPANFDQGVELDPMTRMKINDRDIGVAIDGDRVTIRVTDEGRPEWRKKKDAARKRRGEKPHPSARKFDDIIGKIVDIVERRDGPIVGIYLDRGRFKNVQPDDGAIPQIDITDSGDAQSGQKVSVKLTKWDNPKKRPVGKIVEVIGWPDAPGVDIVSVIKRHNLQQEFPVEVTAAADACPKTLSMEELDARYDCRDHLIVTVDPFDARDHDDACFVEKLENGDWQLSVHIADVSHYVKPNDALDIEAQKRGNSTYLVDRVLPMLPKVLSNELCSLTPDADSATKCAVMTISPKGVVKKTKFYNAVIRSKARLSYEDAQEMIDGTGGGEIGDVIRESWALASVLRKARFDNGALDMEFPETKVICNEKGIPTDITLSHHTTSHQMVEEFMLLANEAVAKALKNRQKPAVYRIHEDPDPDKLLEYGEMATTHDYRPGDLTNRNHIQKLLDASRGKPEEYAIKLGLLKSLKRATYSVEALGHYGLNKANYCHFTSPIRRYADLIVHRALQPLLENPPKDPDRTPSQATLSEICQHISTTERTSAEAETETKRMKQMEYLLRRLEAGDAPQYLAVITDVRKMGLFIECPDILQRGVVRREDLPRGTWRYDEGRKLFSDGKKVISMGEKIMVEVSRVDSVQQHVDFKVVEQD